MKWLALLLIATSVSASEPELTEVYAKINKDVTFQFKNTPNQVINYVLKNQDEIASDYLIAKMPKFAELVNQTSPGRFNNKALAFWLNDYLYEILVRQPYAKDGIVFIVYNYKDGHDMRLTGCVADDNFRIQNSIVVEGTDIKRGLNEGQRLSCEFLKNIWLSQDLTKHWFRNGLVKGPLQ